MGVIRSTLVRRGGTAVLTAGLCLAITVPSAHAATTAGTTKASVSLTGPSSATYGATVQLTGTAWRTGTTTKLVNATIWLQKAAHGTNGWVNLTSTRTNSAGQFTFNVKLVTPYDYRSRYGGSPTYTVAVSPRIYPVVRQNVLFDSIKDTNWELGSFQAAGRIYPTPANRTRVWLQRYNTSTKQWSNYASGLTTGGNSIVIKANAGGNIGLYRIVAPQHGYYATGYSRQVSFAHYKWRGVFRKPVVGQSTNPDAIFEIAPPDVAPNRDLAFLGADNGSSSYVVVSSAGCKQFRTLAVNVTGDPDFPATTETYAVRNGTSYLRGPWTLAPQQAKDGSAAISAIAAVKLELKDASTSQTGGPAAVVSTYVLCAN